MSCRGPAAPALVLLVVLPVRACSSLNIVSQYSSLWLTNKGKYSFYPFFCFINNVSSPWNAGLVARHSRLKMPCHLRLVYTLVLLHVFERPSLILSVMNVLVTFVALFLRYLIYLFAFSTATDVDLSQNDTQSESTTDISSLQYAYDQLLQENQRLQAEQAASSTDTRELIQGLKTIVSEATPKPKPKEPKDPEPTGPNLPECYDQIKPVIKKDNTGPAIAQNIADLLKIAWHNVLPGDDIV